MIVAQARTLDGELTPWESASADWLDSLFNEVPNIERVTVRMTDGTEVVFEEQ